MWDLDTLGGGGYTVAVGDSKMEISVEGKEAVGGKFEEG
jgi:hypothetical protein